MISWEEDCSVYNGHFEVEALIDRSVEEVWPHFLDIGSWVTSHHIETIGGAPNTVGSTTRVSFRNAKELGVPPAYHHYCRLIEVIPQRQWVLKTYSEKGGSYGMQMTGFDKGLLLATGDKTRTIFEISIEIRSKAVAESPATMNLDVSREGMVRNLLNLKRIVEAT